MGGRNGREKWGRGVLETFFLYLYGGEQSVGELNVGDNIDREQNNGVGNN